MIHKQITINKWTTKTLFSMIASIVVSYPAYASKVTSNNSNKSAVDYFSAGPKENKSTTSSSITSASTKSINESATKWFEQFDDIVAAHKTQAAENVILSRPFNQEAERVKQWTDTAKKVISRYQELALTLKSMPVPKNTSGIKEYKDLTADWYSDAANIYEDLIKPRQPARTIEELDSGLNEIRDRAKSLAQTNTNIKAMDMSLRKTYRVHLARTEDALQQYVGSR